MFTVKKNAVAVAACVMIILLLGIAYTALTTTEAGNRTATVINDSAALGGSRAGAKNISVSDNGPVGENVELDANISLKFSAAVNRTRLSTAFSITPSVEGIKFNWKGKTSVEISHSDFEENTTYNISLPQTENITPGSILVRIQWTFTTKQVPELNYTIMFGKLEAEDGSIIKGAEITATLTSREEYFGKSDKNGTIVFAELPFEQFPAGTKFKAEHKDYKDPVEWELDGGIPEFKEGAFPFFVFIVTAVILLVFLVVVIFLFLYKGKENEVEEEAETEDGQFECPECGALVNGDAAKCSECGEKFSEDGRKCPECDSPIDIDTTTCDECGAEFDDDLEK